MGNFEHPLPLEGAHADAGCADCHAEGQEVSADCAGCHEPPSDPHFGPNCEDCHTPTSFADADLPAELHPIPLEGAHATASCEGCHAGDATPEFVCSNCHEPPENHLPGECEACHNPTGFVESASTLVSLAAQITHPVEGREDCLLCHDPAGQIQPAPSNHAEYASEQCQLCHKLAE